MPDSMPPRQNVTLHPTVAAIADEMRAWRHHLHAHPETAFEEHQTAAFVAEKLASFGIPVATGIGRTGVVGTIQGRRTASDAAPARSIALRADMDALHVTELNQFAHRSQNPGRMHACGHDGHTTMLLGAARVLAADPDFAGTVHVIFQPAEENEGGGRAMVEDGLFDRFPADMVFGMHNWPGLAVGHMAMAAGPMMAGFDIFEIVVRGRGCHAAMPDLGHDAVTATAHLVAQLQSIPGRSINPLASAVVSVTQIHGGDTWNVIPEEMVIRGTTRSFSPDVQAMIEARLASIAEHTAAAHGCTASLRYERRYPATVNTAPETARADAAAMLVVGDAAIDRNPVPSMASEDFAFMLHQRPGAYVWLGNGPTDGGCLLHNPAYDFNDDAAPIGASYWVRLVETVLGG
ncbi:M20 aminoacylase family protein [Tistrella sp. BH-R2-4]|uniref:M20 aminoacylase family protein n=1 Tax=Tistrella arctica TaxID=3133430 RepID=A0ABU9YQF6_9PROT